MLLKRKKESEIFYLNFFSKSFLNMQLLKKIKQAKQIGWDIGI